MRMYLHFEHRTAFVQSTTYTHAQEFSYYNCSHYSSIWMAPCEALLGTTPEVGTLPKTC